MNKPLASPILLLLLAARPGAAQSEERPLNLGGLAAQGSFTIGMRLTDVSGYQPKFQELFNLRGGLRLRDFTIHGDDPAHVNRFVDRFSLTATGIGGDPFTTAQFQARKNRLYDLRVNWRQSQYYWNRNDSAALPSGLHALTSNHDWATVRKLGTLNLLVHAAPRLRFNFEYYRNTRDGISYTTRSLEYFGAPSAWGGFARANPYAVIAPLSEDSNRVTAGLDYTPGAWAFHYKAGYQRFESAVQGQQAASPQRSLNIDDATTAREQALGISWIDSRRLSTPVSEFSYTGKFGSRWSTRGGYLFYRYRGPSALDYSFDGTARTTSSAVTAPFAISLAARARTTEPNHVVDQGFSYRAKDWWVLSLDYRYNRFTVDARGNFRSVNGVTVAAGEALTQWRVGTHTVDAHMQFTPAAGLLIAGGIRLMKNDVAYVEHGITDPGRTRRIHTVWPVASLFWEPARILTIRADMDALTNGASYTRVTPHTDRGGRIVVRVRPSSRFYLENAFALRNRRLLDTGYRATVRTQAVTATYEFSAKLSALAGFSYDSYFASNFVNFVRGAAPITDLYLRDQTVSRVWQGGLRTGPWKGAGLQFSGNFVRTTGSGEIAGELPLYGPVSFPHATADIYYDLPRVGRLTVQLQRAYYTEQIVPGNNFSAKMLTVAWTRSLTAR